MADSEKTSESSDVKCIESIPQKDIEGQIAHHGLVQRSVAIRRKFDHHIMPIVCVLYVLSFLDRGNIGNAKTAGAQSDLGLNSVQWTWILNSFYIAYVLFEWTVLFWKIFPAHIYVTVLCVLWGSAAMCSGAVQNMAGLVACRAFLGVFEAAFGAGAPYFLSLFYHRRELGLRVSLLLGMNPLANCAASSIAYGITQITAPIRPWRLLFVIEGAPTIAFAPIVYFLLADSPANAKFLTEDQQTEAVERLQVRDHTAKEKINWKQFLMGMADYQNYIHTLIHFSCNYSYASLSNFLPTIVASMGYSSINAQGVIAPAYFAGFLMCILSAYISDRYGKRGYIIAALCTMSGTGYLLLVICKTTAPRYVGIWLSVCGIFPALALNITWLLNNNGGDSKRGAGLAILAIFGQCSSFISSSVYPDSDAPFYIKGCAIGCAFTWAIVVLALGLHFKLEHENRKRDREYGPVDPRAQLDVSHDGDRHAKFRYLT